MAGLEAALLGNLVRLLSAGGATWTEELGGAGVGDEGAVAGVGSGAELI